MNEGEKIVQVNIEEEMKTAYIDYSMSVIISRALPDVRDGLKPVHRRVLFGMSELGLLANKAHKKSARIVGEVLGKYHPHGDSSVYEAMVRMAQPWSLRYPLVDGQGNFGSVDGDSPAAMRYTEARLQKIAEETLADIDKNTVDFRLNFDDSLEEPTVLPTRIPVLLVNGASGIAVGMATNMPPHNLGEVVDATIAYIDNNEITVEELLPYIKGPDFPTGGFIYGHKGIREAFETGRGRIVVRARTEIETTSTGRTRIVVTEIPYLVNKAELIQKTAALINEKKIEGISYINDESDRNGLRIVIILKKEAVANVVLNNLLKYTQLQTSFSVNNIALVAGRPRVLNLKQLIHYFVKHRHEVVVRRAQFDLDQAEKKKHILEGLLIALDHLDEVIKLIRSSANPEIAKDGLMSQFGLSELQAKAILELRLQRLTGLERDKIREEHAELVKLIAYLNRVLSEEPLRMQIIKDELLEVKSKYNDVRRTEIVPDAEVQPGRFYANDDVVITLSHMGYIKRTFCLISRPEAGESKGSKRVVIPARRMEYLFGSATMQYHAFLYRERTMFLAEVYDIPRGAKRFQGQGHSEPAQPESEDTIRACINVRNLNDEEYVNNHYIVLCAAGE
ncbi:MAG: DNA topoisomerase (ATP-hydrolyzing) [Bacteroidales bacterium]